MATDLRFECPTCGTSYTPARCGVPVDHTEPMSVVVKCTNCQTVFDVQTEPNNWNPFSEVYRHRVVVVNKREG
jgi:predicted Zn finger-like uncharacterized protein